MIKRLLVIFTLAALLAGCIKFSSQSCSWSHSAEKDELRIFQHYSDIKCDKPVVSDKEISQIESVINGERTFFFANWIFEFSRGNYSKWIAETEAKLAKDETESTELKQQLVKVLRIALKQVKVENGGFYINQEGELCAWQKVKVSKVSTLLKEGNRLIHLQLQREIAKGDFKPSKRLPENFSYLSISSNRLSLKLPLDYKEMMRGRRDLAKLLKGAAAENRDQQSKESEREALLFIATLLRQDTWIDYRNQLLSISCGREGAATNGLSLAGLMGSGSSLGLIDYLRKRGHISSDVDIDKELKSFLNF